MDREERHALVGRVRELAELDLALDRLAAGDPWFVQIIGEPGIGKSRLLDALCARAVARGHLVLDGRAAEFERDIPFGLLVDALNDYLASLEPAILRALDDDVVPRRDPSVRAPRGPEARRRNVPQTRGRPDHGPGALGKTSS